MFCFDKVLPDDSDWKSPLVEILEGFSKNGDFYPINPSEKLIPLRIQIPLESKNTSGSGKEKFSDPEALHCISSFGGKNEN